MITTLAIGLSSFMIPEKMNNMVVESTSTKHDWPYSRLKQQLNLDNVKSMTIKDHGNKILSLDVWGMQHITDVLPSQISEMTDHMARNNLEVIVGDNHNLLTAKNIAIGLLSSLLIFRYLPRENLNESLQTNYEVTKFDDIAGYDEVKTQMQEIVKMIRFPDTYLEIGAKTPSGILLSGSPGTGKTLFAKAIAGESDIPFISTHASSFVEVYAGIGAAKIRNLFNEARKLSPCIIFIDEIDSIGKQRGNGHLHNNEEREHALNQLLSEMDGFVSREGVTVIAATNRPDVLDEALTRPGRFDRKIHLNLPNLEERRAILEKYASKYKVSENIGIQETARLISGFSGSDISILINEAAISSVRNNKKEIDEIEIQNAIDKIEHGVPKRSPKPTPDSRIIAYHEAGHALVGYLLSEFDSLHKITIVPRTNGIAGYTQFLPKNEHSMLHNKKYFEEKLSVLLAGRAAEQLVFGPEYITVGASDDLHNVKKLTKQMITQWGYGDFIISSAENSCEVENEMTNIVSSAHDRTMTLIRSNMDSLRNIAALLMEKETIYREDVIRIVTESMEEVEVSDLA